MPSAWWMGVFVRGKVRFPIRLTVRLAARGHVAQPDREVFRLHRLVDHREQPLPQRFPVDFIARGRTEALERARSVILAPVEATVDR